MANIIGFIVMILFICMFSGMFYFIAGYSVHMDVTKALARRENAQYDYVSFQGFLKEYEGYANKYRVNKRVHSQYMSIPREDVFLDKTCVQFGDRYIIFYPWSYFKYLDWLEKQFDIAAISQL